MPELIEAPYEPGEFFPVAIEDSLGRSRRTHIIVFVVLRH